MPKPQDPPNPDPKDGGASGAAGANGQDPPPGGNADPPSNGGSDDPAGAASTDPPTADPPTPPAPPAPSTVSMPTRALSKLKQEERRRGQQAAEATMLKRYGVASIEELDARLADPPADGAGDPPNPEGDPPAAGASGNPPAPDRRVEQLEQENQRLLNEKRRLNRARAQAERARKQSVQSQTAHEAASELKLAAVRLGIQDPDYALTLLKRHLAGKTAAEIDAFDEEKYFSTALRKSHPFLFNATSQPANTGPPDDPPAPGGGAGSPPGNAQPKSAREMTRAEYEASLAAKGLTNPALGSPA